VLVDLGFPILERQRPIRDDRVAGQGVNDPIAFLAKGVGWHGAGQMDDNCAVPGGRRGTNRFQEWIPSGPRMVCRPERDQKNHGSRSERQNQADPK
jgi:hypothetical protein